MALQFKNLRRLAKGEWRAIQRQAARVREAVAGA